MKGMELSKAYFEEYGKPLIDTRLLQYRPYIAAGLVGEGSECLGFDDDISTDHDFGPAYCIWCRSGFTSRQALSSKAHMTVCRQNIMDTGEFLRHRAAAE